MSGLRDLDDRVVPRLATWLRTRVDAARTRPSPSSSSGDPSGPEASARGFLRRLDDRYASSGPLALLREVPQVGLAVAAALFLTGAGVAVARGGGGDSVDRGAQTAQARTALGPAAGTAVPDYVARVGERAVALSAEAPDDVHVGLVSLTRYVQPEELASLLDGLEVRRAYLAVPSTDPGEVLAADVQDVVGDLRGLYAATAARRAEDREEFIRTSRGIVATTPAEIASRDSYELAARVAGREAAAYRAGRPCVFAAVVEGPARVLAALPAFDGVRAVELAPAGTGLSELRVRPLPPEQTGTVTTGEVPRPGPTGG